MHHATGVAERKSTEALEEVGLLKIVDCWIVEGWGCAEKFKIRGGEAR